MPPSKEIIPNEQNQIHTHEFPAQMIGKEAGEGHHLESTGCGLRPLEVLPPSLPRRPPNLLKILQWLPLGGRIKSKLLSPVSKAPVTSCLPLRHSPVSTCPSPTQTYLQVPKCSPPPPPPLSLLCTFADCVLFVKHVFSLQYLPAFKSQLKNQHFWGACVNSFGWLRGNFSAVTVVK